MNALQLLEVLAGLDVRLAVDAGRLTVDAPAGAMTPELVAELRSHRDIVVAALRGAVTGHTLAACDTCGEVSMIQTRPKKWPACRMTPGCAGHHVGHQLRHTPDQPEPATRTAGLTPLRFGFDPLDPEGTTRAAP